MSLGMQPNTNIKTLPHVTVYVYLLVPLAVNINARVNEGHDKQV